MSANVRVEHIPGRRHDDLKFDAVIIPASTVSAEEQAVAAVSVAFGVIGHLQGNPWGEVRVSVVGAPVICMVGVPVYAGDGVTITTPVAATLLKGARLDVGIHYVRVKQGQQLAFIQSNF